MGQDKGTKLFVSFDVELILAKKFSYKTVDINNPNTNVTVFTKSDAALTYRYNVAYYLNNAEQSTSKLKPFVAVGANFIMSFHEPAILSTSPANSNPQNIVEFNSLSFGANAGIGCIYALNEKFGLKVIAGYNYQSPNNKSDVKSDLKYGQTLSQLYTSHPYVGVGLRYAIEAE